MWWIIFLFLLDVTSAGDLPIAVQCSILLVTMISPAFLIALWTLVHEANNRHQRALRRIEELTNLSNTYLENTAALVEAERHEYAELAEVNAENYCRVLSLEQQLREEKERALRERNTSAERSANLQVALDAEVQKKAQPIDVVSLLARKNVLESEKAALEAERAELRAQVSTLGRERDEANRTIASSADRVKTTVDQLTRSTTSHKSTKEEVRRLRKENEEAVDDLEHLHRKHQELSDEIDSLRDLEVRNRDLRKESAALRRDLRIAEGSKRRSDRYCTRMCEENELLEEEVAELEKTLLRRNEELSRLKAAEKAAVGSWANVLTRIQKERDDAQKDLAEEKDRVGKSQAETSLARWHQEELQSEVADLRLDIQRLQQTATTNDEGHAEVVMAYQSNAEDLCAAKNEATARVTDLLHANQEANEVIAAQAQQLRDLQKQLRDLNTAPSPSPATTIAASHQEQSRASVKEAPARPEEALTTPVDVDTVGSSPSDGGPPRQPQSTLDGADVPEALKAEQEGQKSSKAGPSKATVPSAVSGVKSASNKVPAVTVDPPSEMAPAVQYPSPSIAAPYPSHLTVYPSRASASASASHTAPQPKQPTVPSGAAKATPAPMPALNTQASSTKAASSDVSSLEPVPSGLNIQSPLQQPAPQSTHSATGTNAAPPALYGTLTAFTAQSGAPGTFGRPARAQADDAMAGLTSTNAAVVTTGVAESIPLTSPGQEDVAMSDDDAPVMSAIDEMEVDDSSAGNTPSAPAPLDQQRQLLNQTLRAQIPTWQADGGEGMYGVENHSAPAVVPAAVPSPIATTTATQPASEPAPAPVAQPYANTQEDQQNWDDAMEQWEAFDSDDDMVNEDDTAEPSEDPVASIPSLDDAPSTQEEVEDTTPLAPLPAPIQSPFSTRSGHSSTSVTVQTPPPASQIQGYEVYNNPNRSSGFTTVTTATPSPLSAWFKANTSPSGSPSDPHATLLQSKPDVAGGSTSTAARPTPVSSPSAGGFPTGSPFARGGSAFNPTQASKPINVFEIAAAMSSSGRRPSPEGRSEVSKGKQPEARIPPGIESAVDQSTATGTDAETSDAETETGEDAEAESSDAKAATVTHQSPQQPLSLPSITQMHRRIGALSDQRREVTAIQSQNPTVPESEEPSSGPSGSSTTVRANETSRDDGDLVEQGPQEKPGATRNPNKVAGEATTVAKDVTADPQEPESPPAGKTIAVNHFEMTDDLTGADTEAVATAEEESEDTAISDDQMAEAAGNDTLGVAGTSSQSTT